MWAMPVLYILNGHKIWMKEYAKEGEMHNFPYAIVLKANVTTQIQTNNFGQLLCILFFQNELSSTYIVYSYNDRLCNITDRIWFGPTSCSIEQYNRYTDYSQTAKFIILFRQTSYQVTMHVLKSIYFPVRFLYVCEYLLFGFLTILFKECQTNLSRIKFTAIKCQDMSTNVSSKIHVY